MTNLIPYFAGFITIIFAIGFLYALITMRKQVEKDK